MDISQKYVQINTELSTDQATVVNAMSGRQGDNKREVFFQLKDGQFPHNLSGQDVRLVVKDAKGVLKVLSGMNNVSNLALGRFSMVIPWNFYQAAGDILDGYLQVTEGDKVISTIPIHYTVYTNQGTFVQTDDKVFLSDVQTLVDDINSRFKGATQNLEAMETATKLLQQALDNVTAQINGKGLASKGDDNTFTGSNTFTNPIKGSL
ncbi:BppU family phage baseplate upper protein, partial [Convivina intestini]